VPSKSIVHHFTLLEQFAGPQIDSVVRENGGLHFVAEYPGKIAQQHFLVVRAEQLQRAAVDVEDVDFAHATRDELLMDISEDAQVLDAAVAHNRTIRRFDAAESSTHAITRRIGRNRPKALIYGCRPGRAGRPFPLGHVLDRHHDAVPALFVAGKDPAAELDIETLPVSV